MFGWCHENKSKKKKIEIDEDRRGMQRCYVSEKKRKDGVPMLF